MIFGGGQHECDIYVWGIRLILSDAWYILVTI